MIGLIVALLDLSRFAQELLLLPLARFCSSQTLRVRQISHSSLLLREWPTTAAIHSMHPQLCAALYGLPLLAFLVPRALAATAAHVGGTTHYCARAVLLIPHHSASPNPPSPASHRYRRCGRSARCCGRGRG